MHKIAVGVLAILLWATAPAAADCEEFAYCSQIFYAQGECSGLDTTPIIKTPWEKTDIAINGVTIGLDVFGQRWRDWIMRTPVVAYAFAGNNVNPDVMGFQVGSGTSTTMHPSGKAFFFPAPNDTKSHIDLHVSCSGVQRYQAWLVVFYSPLKPSR